MRQLAKGVYFVGAVDFDRRLFDELIELPDGTSYNAYLVKASDKTALIDTVDPTKKSTLIDNLLRAGVDRIDYIISNHAEQDHSGAIPDVITVYPDAKVVTNAKCRDMLIDLLDLNEDRFITVEDGECLSLGDKTLQFVFIPWVHWPETMGTFLPQEKIFFSCDFFGSHLATGSLFADDEAAVYLSAKRYYAEIMMPFRQAIKKNIEKISQFQIDIIAASHGPIYRKPAFIIDAYKDWISDNVKNEVIVPYVSMHHSTGEMVDYFLSCLVERGISVNQLNLAELNTGKLAMSLVDAATVVIGSPTVLAGAHPKAAYAAMLVNALRPKTRFVSIIGSYGWGGKMVEQIKGLLSNLKAEMIEPVVAKGCPKEQDFEALEKLADEILQRHRAIGIAG